MERFEDEIQRQEASLFVGRVQEQRQFQALLTNAERRERILNVYGTGGVGKSWLIRQYQRIAKDAKCLFILVDLRDFVANAGSFRSYLQQILDIPEQTDPVQAINDRSMQSPVIVAIDSYENAVGFDLWLRDSFLCGLSRQTLVIIAGRERLGGEWLHSAAWKALIASQQLRAFTPEETELFFQRSGIADEQLRIRAAAWSGGMPLLLSLALPHGGGEYLDTLPKISELSGHWLSETAHDSLWELAECASLFRSFNQELLGSILEHPISNADFQAFIRLSFILPAQQGWYIHDIAREAIQASFRRSKPGTYDLYRERCIRIYAQALAGCSDSSDKGSILQELLYQISDSMLRSIIAASSGDSGNRLEPLQEQNYPEVLAYVQRRKQSPLRKTNRYVDYEADALYTCDIHAAADARRAELVNPADWLALGSESAKLLRGPDGATIGLFVAIPIHRNSLSMLSTRPVTRAYFQMLSPEERIALAAPPESPCGWYIRVIDAADPADSKAKAELLRHAIRYIATGGLILYSTPVAFYQELLCRLGFEEVPGAAHDDYGPEQPAPTFRLDLRNQPLAAYVNRLAAANGLRSPVVPAERSVGAPFRLTPREKDIARLLLQGHTNPEIAGQLYISEITVKKHVSQLLQKTSSRNRGQLIKNLLEHERSVLADPE